MLASRAAAILTALPATASELGVGWVTRGINASVCICFLVEFQVCRGDLARTQHHRLDVAQIFDRSWSAIRGNPIRHNPADLIRIKAILQRGASLSCNRLKAEWHTSSSAVPGCHDIDNLHKGGR